jgi:hypothetical protein
MASNRTCPEPSWLSLLARCAPRRGPSRSAFGWALPVWIGVAGCNALLGNADHDIATGDGSSATSLDSGMPGAPGATGPTSASAPDSAAGEPDAGEADVQGPSGDSGLGTTTEGDAGTDAGETSAAVIAFVQATSQDTKNSVTAASATYANPQQAGDLDVVVVGWSDSSHGVSSISDSAGNVYVRAAAPASANGVVLAIYYAAKIASAASNTVTVHLDASDYLCLAILEYTGVTAVDQTAAGSGAGTAASTSTVITSLPRELVFGAGEADQTGTANFSSAGSGFDKRVVTGISGMLAEDTITTEAGTYAASGSLNSSSDWVMQVVTFK